ncbi:hypothetical protein T12_7244 [Trichinella patagoniensis]|uniref:Transmembrane protein n=1 Tax=Trichinella patagoniensis TaxID=990121 RepID=A0A0V1A7Y9_9BILA|nr:hypothetical protein T12_7244 [Trichinella patagoniensis]
MANLTKEMQIKNINITIILFYELLVFNSYPLLKLACKTAINCINLISTQNNSFILILIIQLYQEMRQIKMSVHVTTAIILKITISSRRINGLFGVSKIEIE